MQLSLSLGTVAEPLPPRTRKRRSHGDRSEFTCHSVEKLMEVVGILESKGYVRVDDMGELGHYVYLVLDDLGGYLVIWREKATEEEEVN